MASFSADVQSSVEIAEPFRAVTPAGQSSEVAASPK